MSRKLQFQEQLKSTITERKNSSRAFVIAESGTWDGRRALQMIKAALEAGHRRVLYRGFDFWEQLTVSRMKYERTTGRIYSRAEAYGAIVRNLGSQRSLVEVQLYTGDSRILLEGLTDAVDLAFVGGGESLPTIDRDFAFIANRLVTTGRIFLDSYRHNDNTRGCLSLCRYLSVHHPEFNVTIHEEPDTESDGDTVIRTHLVSIRPQLVEGSKWACLYVPKYSAEGGKPNETGTNPPTPFLLPSLVPGPSLRAADVVTPPRAARVIKEEKLKPFNFSLDSVTTPDGTSHDLGRPDSSHVRSPDLRSQGGRDLLSDVSEGVSGTPGGRCEQEVAAEVVLPPRGSVSAPEVRKEQRPDAGLELGTQPRSRVEDTYLHSGEQ